MYAQKYITSFQFRIFFALLLVTAIFIPATGYVGYRQASHVVQKQMNQYAVNTAERLVERLHNILSRQGETTTPLSELALQSDSLFFVKEQLTGRILAHSRQRWEQVQPLLNKARAKLNTAEKDSGIVRIGEKQYFTIIQPVTTEPGETWEIVAAFSTADYLEQIQVIKKTAISFIIAAIILAALLSYLLSKSIMKPLLKLRQGIDRISIGDLEHRVTINDPDIARDLAQSFNKMADSLQKSLNELKNTYAELKEKEKLAAVGKMTAGIAHEIKNPLGIILGSTQVVLDSQRPWKMREKAASFIMDEVVRLDTTLKAFLAFARPATPLLIEVNLAKIFEETLSAIEERYHEEGYTIRCNFQKELPLMEADPGQMRQILMNILLNAFNSMPGGGEVAITIRSEKEPEMGEGDVAKAEKRFISTRNPFTVARDWLIISIADAGCGMGKEKMEKILDPFVSFRDDGIGLGLSIVSQLVKLHRGHIKIDSKAGTGTTFTLFFPCILEEPKETSER